MNTQDLLKQISCKEIDSGCYDARIDGVSIYSLIRRSVRRKVMERSGIAVMNVKTKRNWIEVQKSILHSLWHLASLRLYRHQYKTVFYSFPRVDKIEGSFIDKFTDPLIEECSFDEDYIVFEHGLGGVHSTPRLHQGHVVYIDSLSIIARIYSFLFYISNRKKYSEAFRMLCESLVKAFGGEWDIKEFEKEFYIHYYYSRLLQALFLHVGAKRVIGPARDYLLRAFIAGKKLNIGTYELQHGITYGETEMYSGYRDEMVLPDYFLAFGDNKPKDVYGIDESRIVNIGWALQDYIANLPQKEHYEENDVLVISDPEITDAIFDVVQKLAEGNPSSCFYIRPHPHEVLEERHMKIIDSMANVKLQDKKINITVVLQGFSHIVGENSTVLYEALAIHKKVGRLCYPKLHPKYLEESDKNCFWEIHNQDDFIQFLNDDVSNKDSKCIYSPFNKDLFCETIGLEL